MAILPITPRHKPLKEHLLALLLGQKPRVILHQQTVEMLRFLLHIDGVAQPLGNIWRAAIPDDALLNLAVDLVI